MTDAGGYVLDQNLTRSGLIDIHVLDGQPRSRVFVLAQDCGFQVFLLILWRGGVTCSAPTPRLASSAEQMTLRVKRSAGNADNPAAMPRNSASLSARNIPFYGLPRPVQGLRSRRRRCGPDWAPLGAAGPLLARHERAQCACRSTPIATRLGPGPSPGSPASTAMTVHPNRGPSRVSTAGLLTTHCG